MVATIERPAEVRKAETQAQKRLARLRELANKTGEIVYERAKLAATLLSDKEWLDANHGGDEGQAADWLQSDCFSDLGGLLSVIALAGMYRDVPEAEWREKRWNYKAVYLLWRERTAGATPRREVERVTKKDLDTVQQQLEETRFDVKRKDEEVKRVAQEKERVLSEAEKLRGRVRELEIEVATLRGRLEAMERNHASAV